ncbi:MAG: DUF418 domain-containing protein [Streptosporangiales bacterium]|nr:DUF418 domain-containing protein [Streptosporangiales bacterium]
MDTTARSVSTPVAPRPATRLPHVDALRGFALLGILMVNIAYFASGYTAAFGVDPVFDGPVDDAVNWVVAFVFATKFYLFFSFLFGYSFTLQMDAAKRQEAAFRPRMLRRLAGLFALGALHAVFLYSGDILLAYSVIGLILLVLHRIRPRTAMVVAVVLVVYTSVATFLSGFFMSIEIFDPAANQLAGEQMTETLRGGYGSVIVQHIADLPFLGLTLVAYQLSMALAAFLVGLAAGKRRLLAEVDAHTRALKVICLVGYPIGLAGAYQWAGMDGIGTDTTATAIGMLTSPALTAAYVASLLLFFRTAPGRRFAAALAPAGRMALSNYLGQSLACLLIFTGVGLGLVGHVAPLGVFAIALGIWLGQLVVSRLWMARFQYGPVEWALRAVTNAERPAWRRITAPPTDREATGAPAH